LDFNTQILQKNGNVLSVSFIHSVSVPGFDQAVLGEVPEVEICVKYRPCQAQEVSVTFQMSNQYRFWGVTWTDDSPSGNGLLKGYRKKPEDLLCKLRNCAASNVSLDLK